MDNYAWMEYTRTICNYSQSSYGVIQEVARTRTLNSGAQRHKWALKGEGNVKISCQSPRFTQFEGLKHSFI